MTDLGKASRSHADALCMIRGTALFLTLLTGASGLVYQVAWQKLLASLLGSHSEATAAVLALFLGGLSAGYMLFGAVSTRVVARGGSPLLVYGAVECAIGALALGFAPMFAGIQALSLALPHGSPAVSFALDVGLSALLILPPTILMGGTIPLLTQGLSRRVADATRFHSAVYAFNTAGAFVGAIAAAFVLIPALGLELTIQAMGCVNLGAGLSFVALRRHGIAIASRDTAEQDVRHPVDGFAVYAVVALLAGFAMMSLQTTLNRLGALALGASPFTFAVVVAIFVLSIAIGSFAVAALPRVRPTWVALSQWALTLLLLVIYPHMENSGFWAYVLHSNIGLDTAAAPYYTAVFLSVFAIALVPLALSGALLPLLFHHLREQAEDLGHTAGRLYAWNTAGSLLGALLGGYLLLFWLDLHHIYRLSVVALAVASALLTPRVGLARGHVAALALVGVLCVVAFQPAWRADRLAMGLFRSRIPAEEVATEPDVYFTGSERFRSAPVIFATDDPSTTVTVTANAVGREIIVNGKSDGQIPNDNMTTGLLALLPVLYSDGCERAFVIGYGTGMTVGELAALECTREVVVAEISRGVVEAAPLFESVNRGALANPKTRLVQSDAYRTLLRDQSRYDVIVSEPSNPWVSGVENLYSLEFLRAARDHLAPGGVYAQWYHVYETNNEALALVLATFREVFGRVAVWNGRDSDLILLGFANTDLEPDIERLEARYGGEGFKRQLSAIGLTSFPRLIAHEVLPPGVVAALSLPSELHTLVHPVLSDVAARGFYRKQTAEVPIGLGRQAAAIGARNALGGRLLSDGSPETRLEYMRGSCDLSLSRCATLFAAWLHESPGDPLLRASLARARQNQRLSIALAPRVLEGLAAFYGSDATAGAPPSFELASDLARLYQKYYHHAAPFRAGSLHLAWQRCAETDARCRDRLESMLGQGITSGPADYEVSLRP